MATTIPPPTAPMPRPLPRGARSAWTQATVHPLLAAVRRLVTLLVWRPVLAVVGPLHVSGAGRLPATACVFVADHSSHADAVLMRVALARAGRHRVVAAAAEDHWFTSRGRAILAVVGAGAFPFPRHGDIGLRRAAALLATGHDVIMFPQGSRDAAARDWRCGAGRLAVTCGATLVGVTIDGAAELLPKGTAWPSPRPLAVAFGDPVRARAGEGAVEVTARVRAATVGIDPDTEGRLVGLSCRLRANAVRRGTLILAVWAFAEATIWPLIPDLLLAGLVFAVPRLGPRLVAVAAGASAIGGAVAVTLARAGLTWPLPAVTSAMQQQAVDAISQHGARGLLAQPLSGVPYKAFNSAGAGTDIEVLSWVGWTVTARGMRMAVVALMAWAAGRLLWSARVPEGWAPRLHAVVVLTGLVLFVLGWAAVLLWWR
ncbi:MAG TPA: lysophospholipid acyltransferase family protein [Euzebya sp.]|nr:lysophospholipid acyltransferase family protein [Euzebya sp.]